NRNTLLLLEACCDYANELPRGLYTGVDPKLLNAAFCRNADDPPNEDDEASPKVILEVAPKAGVEPPKAV
ncbi:hypothetical protein Tco_0739381, partial [Tanacetum coccineum]